MKKFLCIILAVSMLISLAGCVLTQSAGSYERSGPPMWIVTDKEGNRCYILASMNVPEQALPFADVIEDAFSFCPVYFTTSDTGEVEELLEQQSFYLTDGTVITDHISKSTYEAAKSVIARYQDAPGDTYDDRTPAFWYFTVSALTSDKKFSADPAKYYADKARSAGKQIKTVMTAQEYVDMLTSADDATFEYLISSASKSSGSATAALYAYYMIGDADTFAALRDAAGSNAAAVIRKYSETLYETRAEKTAQTVADQLAAGELSFFVSDISILSASGGVISLLKKAGYKVVRK